MATRKPGDEYWTEPPRDEFGKVTFENMTKDGLLKSGPSNGGKPKFMYRKSENPVPYEIVAEALKERTRRQPKAGYYRIRDVEGMSKKVVVAMSANLIPLSTMNQLPDPRLMSDEELVLQAVELIKVMKYDWSTNALPHQREPDEYDIWLLCCGRGVGKDLALETPITTPGGATAMGALRVGDEVFDEAGRICRVTFKSDVRIPEICYRVSFSDGTFIDASSEHQWVTWTHGERKQFLRSQYEQDHTRFPVEWPQWRATALVNRKSFSVPREKVEEALALHRGGMSARKIQDAVGVSRGYLAPHLRADRYVEPVPVYRQTETGPRIRLTQELFETQRQDNARQNLNHCVPLAGALQLAAVGLPIDPYVLGYWLGDGTSCGGSFACHEDDQIELCEQLESAGYGIGRNNNSQAVSALGLVSHLRSAGVLNNKHVPAVYFRGSVEQRESLLAGLLDSDGTCDKDTGMVEFCNTKRRLADAVLELARSLGQKPTLNEGRATFYGKDCGPKYRVTWRPTSNPFALQRKAALYRSPAAQGLRSQHRMIVSVERIESKPMQCIQVDSKNSMYLAGDGMIPTHNTKAGSETVRKWATEKPGVYAVVALGHRELRDVCLNGDSGLLNAFPPDEVASIKTGLGDLSIKLKNGSEIVGFTSGNAEALRGREFEACWADEYGAWARSTAQEVLDQLLMCMRKSDRPRLLITTTPRKVPHIVDLFKMAEQADKRKENEPLVLITHASIEDNPHLSDRAVGMLRATFDGTRQGKQELDGLLLLDVEGALWTDKLLGYAVMDREEDLPLMRKVIVGYDYAGSDTGDPAGVVAVGWDAEKTIYVLDNRTTGGTPADRYSAGCMCAYENKASEIWVEGNQGDAAGFGLKKQWETLVEQGRIPSDAMIPHIRPSNIKGNKADRANPLVALYERHAHSIEQDGRPFIRHVAPTATNRMAFLESELTSWEPHSRLSPNGLDALVHAGRQAMIQLGYEASRPTYNKGKRRIDKGWSL